MEKIVFSCERRAEAVLREERRETVEIKECWKKEDIC